MAKIFLIYNPTTVVAADTNVNEIQFGAEDLPPQPNILSGSPAPMNHNAKTPIIPVSSLDKRVIAKIKVTVGSIKFAVAQDPTSNPLTVAIVAGEVIELSFHNGVSNIFFKATGVSNAFQITV